MKIDKERFINHDKLSNTCFGRVLSTTYTKNTLWSAVQIEQEKRKSKIAVIYINDDILSQVVLELTGSCHQPFIIPQPCGGITLVWNGFHKSSWSIHRISLDEQSAKVGKEEIIFSSPHMCLPPTATYWNGELWVAWPGINNDTGTIYLARRKNGIWHVVSKRGTNAFRPYLASNDDGVFLAWDQYEKSRYEVVFSKFDGSRWRVFKASPKNNERWFCPKLLASERNCVYLTWVVLRTVSDSQLGIVDHFPFAMVASFVDDSLKYMLDKSNASGKRVIADFREGLLISSGCYRGYKGLRRNPFLSISQNGELWCLWEMAMEQERSHYSGYLVGRKLRDDTTWTPPFILHSQGYGYSVSTSWAGDKIPIAFFKFNEAGLDKIDGALINPTKGVSYQINNKRWQRWKTAHIRPQHKSKRKIKHEKKEYSLFWADTHCHSIFSYDAEGEVDELIHFARDVAKLDAVAITDNDFYSHKALTKVEWRINQEFSDHFTKEGEFIIFPGWEYSYYRRDINPPLNHRIILYPRANGQLFRRIDSDTDSDEKLFKKIKGKKVICYPHHCSYKLMDPGLDRNVEVCSSWRVCIEEADFTLNLLKSGKKFGFIGSSDSHRAIPGLGGALTGIFSEDLTPEGLFDAYNKRRIIATQGFFVFIDFRVGDAFIGEERQVIGYPEIRISIEAPREIEVMEILRDGYIIYKKMPYKQQFSCRFTDRSVRKGEHFYFSRVKLIGDPSFSIDPARNSYAPFSMGPARYSSNLARARGVFAWTSPIWLSVKYR